MPGPLNLLALRGGLSIAELAGLGVRRISLASSVFQLVVEQLSEVADALVRGVVSMSSKLPSGYLLRPASPLRRCWRGSYSLSGRAQRTRASTAGDRLARRLRGSSDPSAGRRRAGAIAPALFVANIAAA